MQAFFKEQLERYDLDGLYVTNPINIRYLSGFTGSFGVVLVTKEKMTLVTDARYYEEAKRICQGTSVVLLGSQEWLGTITKCKKIGFESNSMTVERFEQVSQKFSHAEWHRCTKIMEDARRRKNAFELTAIHQACRIADKCLHTVLHSIKAGMSEVEIAKKLEESAQTEGIEKLSFPTIVAFEENAAIPHHKPGNRKLKKGDVILIDYGVMFHGYCSDMTRTFFFQEISNEKRNAYNIVFEAQKKGRESIHAGKETFRIFKTVNDFFAQHQVDEFFTHSLGHGVGLDIHEPPYMKQGSEEILQEYDVVSCEPGLYFPNKFGIRIEDLGVVKKDGYEVFTAFPKDLVVLKYVYFLFSQITSMF